MIPAEIAERMERREARRREWWGQPRMEWRKILARLPDDPQEVADDLADFITDMMNSHGFYETQVEDAFEETDNGVIRAALGAALGLDPFYGITFNRHMEAAKYYRDLAWSRILLPRREETKGEGIGS